MNSALDVRELSKDYFNSRGSVVHALRSLSFNVQAGEVFGLLGSNGAGKTTALRILSTMLRPTGGAAIIAGHDICLQPQMVRRSIGFLSTGTGLYGRLTAEEMIIYFGELNGMTRFAIRARLKKIAELLDMTSYLDRRCDKLSSGQRQRVNIARTLIHDPPVLILDEPTTGLDVLAAAQIVDLIRDSRNRGCSVIVSTHNMLEAEKLCERLLILHNGEVRFDGRFSDLKQTHKTDDPEVAFLRAIGCAAS